LPGIAGIILTIGMSVDANVLIFERIREELRVGRTPLNAIESGYEKAMSTILDANITTLIAALVLFQFGTGPIKGFAVTLSIGILSSMFTAIFVTRTIFLTFFSSKEVKKLSI
jgi:preprotein translocase subunit SecD